MTLHVDRIDLADAVRTGVNPYLAGPYAPTHDEVTLRDLEVVGEIPDDLNGVYVRNGPNPQHEPIGRYHWFDGDGMVHAVHFADGQADLPQPLGAHRRLRARARRPARRSGGHHRAVRPTTRPTSPRRTRPTPTSCSTATACSRSGTAPASRTRSTR